MADDSYDVVIVGGGTKGLFLAMYLIKYGGLSVGIFERRHEIGGCMATEETAAPGFRGNTHANMLTPMYHCALMRDFPEIWHYGLQFDQHLCSDGAVFSNNGSCLAIYSEKHDPTQERTAKEIARFSEKDAEAWLKLWRAVNSDELLGTQMDMCYLPGEERATIPQVLDRQMAVAAPLMEAGFLPDELIMVASGIRAVREYWESQELQYCILRWMVSAAIDINDPGLGAFGFMMAQQAPILGFIRGGTHQVAHAVHQWLAQHGCKFFTHAEVEKVTIENGTATGIRLANGSEIAARKMVVAAGMHPAQLCFDLIGREHLDEMTAKHVDLLENKFGCLMWYSFAVHEPPKYTAEAMNPDIHECMWLGLAADPSPEHIATECRWVKLGLFPNRLEDYSPIVGCHSLVDSSFAPPGKHVIQTEQIAPPASRYSEREWLDTKKRYAEDLMEIWQKHASNMTWDNVIGVDCNSPYDTLRMKNLAPHGSMAGIDSPPHQFVNNTRPTPELSSHRTPVKNLYATGGCWFPGRNMSSMESYTCYRIIAKDHGLGKPWEESGKEEPESLIQEYRAAPVRAREAFPRDPQYSNTCAAR